MFLADGAKITEGLYVQDGRTLYKVSTPSPDSPNPGSTMIVCLDAGDLPPRTTVRYVTAGQLAGMTSASDRLVKRYHARLDAR